MTCPCPPLYRFLCLARKVWVDTAEEHAACTGAPEAATPRRYHNIGACTHRGPAITTAKGNLCGGSKAAFAIYRCPIHTRCSDVVMRAEIKACVACLDFENQNESEATNGH